MNQALSTNRFRSPQCVDHSASTFAPRRIARTPPAPLAPGGRVETIAVSGLLPSRPIDLAPPRRRDNANRMPLCKRHSSSLELTIGSAPPPNIGLAPLARSPAPPPVPWKTIRGDAPTAHRDHSSVCGVAHQPVIACQAPTLISRRTPCYGPSRSAATTVMVAGSSRLRSPVGTAIRCADASPCQSKTR